MILCGTTVNPHVKTMSLETDLYPSQKYYKAKSETKLMKS